LFAFSDLFPISGLDEKDFKQGGKCLQSTEFESPGHFPTDEERFARSATLVSHHAPGGWRFNAVSPMPNKSR